MRLRGGARPEQGGTPPGTLTCYSCCSALSSPRGRADAGTHSAGNWPRGIGFYFGISHVVRPESPLPEMIRGQNDGNAGAYRVV
jgi:hypothetical protein